MSSSEQPEPLAHPMTQAGAEALATQVRAAGFDDAQALFYQPETEENTPGTWAVLYRGGFILEEMAQWTHSPDNPLRTVTEHDWS